jgi:hypothetical protein
VSASRTVNCIATSREHDRVDCHYATIRYAEEVRRFERDAAHGRLVARLAGTARIVDEEDGGRCNWRESTNGGSHRDETTDGRLPQSVPRLHAGRLKLVVVFLFPAR